MQLRDFILPEIRHSRETRLCRFLFLLRHRRHELTDAIPNDVDALNAPAVNALRLEDHNLFNELPDMLCVQVPDVGILPHKVEEALHIDAGFLLGGNQAAQLGHTGFERFLLILVVFVQLHKTLIADFALKIVLVQMLDDLVQLADAGLCLFHLSLSVPQAAVSFGAFLLRDHLHKVILMLSGKRGH